MAAHIWHRLSSGLRGSWTRYPVFLVCALAATMLSIAVIDRSDHYPLPDGLMRWLRLSVIALPLALLSDLRRSLAGTGAHIATIVAILLLLCMAWFSIGHYPAGSSFSELITVFWVLAGILLLSLFAGKDTGSDERWWEGAKDGIITLTGAGVYALVLFISLLLVREALVHLFQVSEPGFHAGDLAAICFILMAALFFTALLPPDWMRRTTATAPSYFSGMLGFLLFPVCILFSVVLYAYLSRILVLQEWPRGWVSVLVFSLSACTIVAWLASYPYRAEHGLWWQRLRRWLMPLLVAPVVAQLMSISVRVDAYDWTIPRYLGLCLGVWLLATALYYSLVRKARLRWLPASALVLVAWTGFSPWNAHRISLQAQQERLLASLDEAGLLDEDRRIAAIGARTSSLSDSTASALRDQFNWLWHEGRLPAFSSLLPEDCLQRIQKHTDSLGRLESFEFLQVLSQCTAIDFSQGLVSQPVEGGMPFFISRDIFQGALSVGISGYDHLVGLTASANDVKTPPQTPAAEWRATLSGDSVIIYRHDAHWGSAATSDWLGVLNREGVYQGRWPDSMRPLQVRSDLGEPALLVPEQMQGFFRENGAVVIRELRAYLLVKD